MEKYGVETKLVDSSSNVKTSSELYKIGSSVCPKCLGDLDKFDYCYHCKTTVEKSMSKVESN
jgi:hypothetical protein